MQPQAQVVQQPLQPGQQVVYQPYMVPRQSGFTAIGNSGLSSFFRFKRVVFVFCLLFHLLALGGISSAIAASSHSSDTIMATAWTVGHLKIDADIDTDMDSTLFLGLHDLVQKVEIPKQKDQVAKVSWGSNQCDAMEKSLDIFCDMCHDMGNAAMITSALTFVSLVLILPLIIVRMTGSDSPAAKFFLLLFSFFTSMTCMVTLILYLNGCASEMPSQFANQQGGHYDYTLGPSSVLTIVTLLWGVKLAVLNLLVPVREMPAAGTGFVAAPGSVVQAPPQYAQQPQFVQQQPQMAYQPAQASAVVVQGQVVQESESKPLV